MSVESSVLEELRARPGQTSREVAVAIGEVGRVGAVCTALERMQVKGRVTAKGSPRRYWVKR